MRKLSYLRPLVRPGDRLDLELVLLQRSDRNRESLTVIAGVVELRDLVSGLAAGSDMPNCHSLGFDSFLGIRKCSLGVAGSCRIEKGLGSCMGRYCTVDFGRRSSRVIHRNNSFKESRLASRV